MRERWYWEESLGQDRVDTTFKLNVKGTTNIVPLTLIGHITSEAGPDTGQSLLHIVELQSNSINKYFYLYLIVYRVVGQWS